MYHSSICALYLKQFNEMHVQILVMMKGARKGVCVCVCNAQVGERVDAIAHWT